MAHYDVFNGDADGICALQQLRLDDPRDGALVTGTKRQNRLLDRVDARAGDTVTALDIALPGNRDALERLLAAGARVQYVDHHEPGTVPAHALLDALIDPGPDTCTSALVDRLLGGRQRRWAIVGAFGDNLAALGERLARTLDAAPDVVERWRALGECINYNAYGLTEADLVYAPAALYRALSPYDDPLRFAEREPHFARLRATRTDDLARARACAADAIGPHARLHRLPDAPWARRVSGSWANLAFNAEPSRIHVVAVPRGAHDPASGAWQASLRVPADAPVGAHALAEPFGGGGRRLAAGIDAISEARLQDLCAVLERARRPGADAAAGDA